MARLRSTHLVTVKARLTGELNSNESATLAREIIIIGFTLQVGVRNHGRKDAYVMYVDARTRFRDSAHEA